MVNGHSYKEKKSESTNLAILCSHDFREPFDRPTTYAQKIGELANMLGDGRILVQCFGDILDGKRTWQDELDRSNVRPTLPDTVAGDITSALPYRTMASIMNFMLAVDEAIPGFAAGETLLYAPEEGAWGRLPSVRNRPYERSRRMKIAFLEFLCKDSPSSIVFMAKGRSRKDEQTAILNA